MCSSGKRGRNLLLYLKITVFLRTESVDVGLQMDTWTVMNVGLLPSTPIIELDRDKPCLSEVVCLVTGRQRLNGGSYLFC